MDGQFTANWLLFVCFAIYIVGLFLSLWFMIRDLLIRIFDHKPCDK